MVISVNTMKDIIKKCKNVVRVPVTNVVLIKKVRDIVKLNSGKVANMAAFPLNKKKYNNDFLRAITCFFRCFTSLFLIFCCFNIKVDASTNDLKFKIMNNSGEEMQVSCIDSEKRLFEAVNPSEHCIWTIEGILPEGFSKVKVRTATGITYTSDTYPDLYINYNKSENNESRFIINQVGSISPDQFDAITHGVFELIFYNDSETDDTLSYFIILDGNPLNSIVANDLMDCFSSQIDLVDSETNEVLTNIFLSEIDNQINPERKLYQKIDLTQYDTDKVALRMLGDNSIPQSFKSVDDAWPMDGEKYYRINGKNWIRFSESNGDRNVLSSNLELEEGNNLVEICQLYQSTWFGKYNDDRIPNYYMKKGQPIVSFSHVLLIHTDKATVSSKDSNTDISMMQAYSWGQKKGDKFIPYQTTVDEDKDQYSIIINKEMTYTPIILSIDTVNPDAFWTIEDENGEDVSLGRIGHYTAFDSNGCSEMFLRVKSADGKATSVKKVQIISGESSSRTDLTGIVFESEDIVLESEGKQIEKTDGIYLIDPAINSYTVSVDEDSFQLGAISNAGATISIDGDVLEKDEFKTIHPSNNGMSEIVVTASDGVTKGYYYLLYKYRGSYPYFGVSDSTKQLADSMLTGYKEYLKKENMEIQSDWWSTFMAKSVGVSLDGAYVYDIRTRDYNILSDYACAALELIAIGENPYDFEGVNYIQETENCLKRGAIGAWDTTLWALIAFKAAGYDYPDMDKLVSKVKEQAWTRISGITWSIDTGSWAWEATKDEFSLEKQAEWAEWIHRDNQRKTGDEAGIFEDYYYGIPNSNTHGCVLGALNALDIDPEKFTIAEGKSPLLTLKEQYMFEDGRFKYNNEDHIWGNVYNKDIIVALGDIVAGESLWDRMTLTSDKMNTLTEKARSIKLSDDEKQNLILEEALQKADNVSDITKEGKVYFDLQDAIRLVDDSALSTSRICSPEVGTQIDSLIDRINSIGEVSEKNADEVLALYKDYEQLNGDIEKRYVSNYKTLEAAVTKAKIIKGEQESSDQIEDLSSDNESSTIDSGNSHLKVQVKPYSTAIKLSWEKIKDINGYDIFRYNTKTKKYKKIASVTMNAKSYTVRRINGSKGSKLKSGTKYKFKVSTYILVEGVKKYKETLKILTSTTPQKVKINALKCRGKREITVSWKRIKRCRGYEIWGKLQGTKYKRLCIIKKKSVNKKSIPNLRKGKKYGIKIRAYTLINKKKIYGAYSKVKTIRVK